MNAVCGVAEAANAGPEGLVLRSGTPRPTGALGNGKVVVAEGEKGRDSADQEAEEDIETVVAEVEPARASDEDSAEEGETGNQEEIERWGGCLSADCGDSGIVLRHSLVNRSLNRGGCWVNTPGLHFIGL